MSTLQAPPTYPPPRDGLGFRPLLEDAVDVLKRHFLLIALPLVVLAVLTGGGQSDTRMDAREMPTEPQDLLVFLPLFAMLGLVAIVVVVVLFFAYVMAWLMASRAALDAAAGRAPADFGDQWREAWPKMLPASGAVLLALLFVILGFIALIVPGFIVIAALLPLSAVVAAEGIGGMRAIKRSWSLTRGHRGTLFLLFLVSALVSIVAGLMLGWIPFVGAALAGIVSGVASAFLAVVGALYYQRVASTIPPTA